ncbi:hypothetical protein [Nonomuraea sp. NPDC048916]|uniref:hypothetical protein n=1 Tax=Nonomuraea sp. NPDC048916 TaxID=3154232 RepID=UPI0033ECEC2F
MNPVQAMRHGALSGQVAADDAIRRVRDGLPHGDSRLTVAHRISDRVLEEDRDATGRARRGLTEIAPATGERTYAAAVLALSRAAGDLYACGRAADHYGRIATLLGDHPHAAGLSRSMRRALADLEEARTRLTSAARVLRRLPCTSRFAPEVVREIKALARLAHEPLPAFDGATSQHLWRPAKRWCDSLARAIGRLVTAYTLPMATEAARPPGAAERAALAELLARPDDTEARLRWAALAGQRGEQRAILVREQVEEREKLRRDWPYQRFEPPAATSLIERHPAWSAEVRRLGAGQVAFRRGFVEWVSIGAPALLRHATELYAAAPILYVRLTGVAPLLPELLASGHLSRLLALDLSGQELDDGHVAQLTSAGLRGLRSLDLGRNLVTETGVRLLYGGGLPALVHCPLEGNPCGPLYTSGWSAHEHPTPEWHPTALGALMVREYGERVWAIPYDHVPDFDVLTRIGDRL